MTKTWTQEEIDADQFRDDDCGNCGGTGFLHDCIDGQCLDAEIGCELCATKCDYCS